MSTKPRNATDRDELFCGCLGCTDPATVVMRHPVHGWRTVCDRHAYDHWVVDHV